MKILSPLAYYDPEQIASSHLTMDLEEAMVSASIEQVIITPAPTRGITKEVRNIYKKRKYDVKHGGLIKVYRFPLFSEGQGTINRTIRYLIMNIIQYFRCLAIKDADVIYAASTPPTQGMLAALIKRKLKIPFVYNLQDIFPDSLVNTGMVKKNSLIWKVGRKIENYTYKNADKIIVISDDFKKNLVAKGVPENKIEVVYNWIDTDIVKRIPRDINILFDKYNLDRTKFYLTYCGNIGYTQNLDMLLDVAKTLADCEQLQFILFGDGAYSNIIDRRILIEKISNVRRIPFQPYADISNVFSLGDVGIVISKPGIGSNSVPSKLLSIMAAECPVLASFDTECELCRVIDRANCGINTEAGDLDSFHNSIIALYSNKKNLSSIGTNGRKYVEKHFCKDINVNMYIHNIISVTSERNRNA